MNHNTLDFIKNRSKIFYTKGLIKFFGNKFFWDDNNKNLVNLRPVNKSYTKAKYSKEKKELNPENTIIVRSKQDAKMRGSTIHQEIEHFIHFGAEMFSLVHPNPDPLTSKIASSLKDRGFVGIFGEYPIWFRTNNPHVISDPVFFSDILDGSIFLASSVDLICFDTKRSKIVLIEIKTGYNNSLFFDQYVSDNELELLKTQKKFQSNKNIMGIPDSFLGSEEFNNPYSHSSSSSLSSSNVPYNKKFTSSEYGYDNNGKKIGYMLKNLSEMKDCPINRAKIQLCAYMIYFREYLKEDCDAYVLHCQTNGNIEYYDINENYYRKYSQILRGELSNIGII